jgi:deoxycytidine triphosphate deaminase/transcriptional regulator with XRE-family HTH domain
MILSDRDILARLADGDLAIEPLEDVDLQVQPASVDVRLGRRFLEFERANVPCIHPNREDEVEDYVTETVVDDGDEFILHPGDFVLGTTRERVEVPPDLVAQVEGRSSLGRLAVVVHASLPADEQLFLWTPEDGFGFHEIGDIVEDERPAHAVSFDPETLRVRTFPVTDFITNPTKRIFRVTLDSGRTVLVTKDHNVFTLDEHGRVTRLASEEAVGERVMVPGTLPEANPPTSEIDLVDLFRDDDEIIAYATDGVRQADWSDIPDGSRRHYESRNSAPMSTVSPSALPEDTEVAFKQSDARLPRTIPITREFAWILGFYVAEGYARRKQVVFTQNDRDHLERVADWFRQYDTPLSWNQLDHGANQVTVCSALWSKLFRRLAGSGDEKNIPDEAWNWPGVVLEAFLDGLLEGDGHRRDGRDTLYTANEELADRATYLGTRLGYLTSTYHRRREQHIDPSGVDHEGDEWSVDFYEDAHKRGQYVPNPSALLRELREEADLRMVDVAEEAGYSSKSSISNIENREYDSVKRDSLERLRDCYASHGADTSRLDQILDGNVQFDRVESVQDTGRVETTYDLEVQPGGRQIENFLGGFGGIFLSNTAGFIDPGYRGQVTLELSNLGKVPVALTPGMRISQLVFTELSSRADRPYGEERGSKYQDQDGPQASRIRGDREFGGDQ